MEDKDCIYDLIKENIHAAFLLRKNRCLKKSISCGYYSMFLIAKICVDPGDILSKHSAVISKFGKEISKNIPECKSLHKYLIETEKLRILCDYHAESQVSEKEVDEVLTWLKEFITKIVNLHLAMGADSALYFLTNNEHEILG